MCDEKDGKRIERKGGYQPFSEGYRPDGQDAAPTALPEGGTASTNTQQGTTPSDSTTPPKNKKDD